MHAQTAANDLRSLLSTELVGFRLTRLVGEGGMAVVFRGENLLDPSIVRAIKIVRPELAARAEFVRRFADEARTLERLQHPNVVRFFGVRSERGHLVMELEMLEGRTLADAVPAQGRVQPELALRTLLAAAEGVAAAHALGIVHRDLKPENIHIGRDTKVKVLDFGLARALDDADRETRATVTGTVPGTPAYMAPEVCMGAIPAPAADVYALGMTLYEVLVGYHPLRPPGQPSPSSVQLMLMQTSWAYTPVSSVLPDVPAGLDAILQRALAKDPAQRYGSARELADALRGLVHAQHAASGGGNVTRFDLPGFKLGTPTPGHVRMPGDDTLSGGPGAPPAPKSRLPAWLLAGGAVAAAALVGVGILVGGIWWLLNRPPEPRPGAEAVEAPAPVDLGPNPWVRVDPPPTRLREGPVLLGVSSDRAPKAVAGFRPARKVTAPSSPFELQTHEVTWGELNPWLASAAVSFTPPDWVAALPDASDYPVGGVPWATALAYCQSLGGTLPTEEQWEYAARGADRRSYPWGDQPLDRARTAALRGPDAWPVPVMTSDQDRTPGETGKILYDLAGNAQEWTADLWREDNPGQDESWVQDGDYSFRAVRGLPLGSTLDTAPAEGSAWREVLCGTGPCLDKLSKTPNFVRIGFRCARAATAEER